MELLEGVATNLPLDLAEEGPLQVFGHWVWAVWHTAFVGAATAAQPHPTEHLAPPLASLAPDVQSPLVALAAVLAMAGGWAGLDALASAAVQQFLLLWRLGTWP